MYGWLWRKLPGGYAGKIGGSVVLCLAALGLLFFVVFPWVEPRLPWNEVTVNSPSIEQTVVPSAPAAPSALPS